MYRLPRTSFSFNIFIDFSRKNVVFEFQLSPGVTGNSDGVPVRVMKLITWRTAAGMAVLQVLHKPILAKQGFLFLG